MDRVHPAHCFAGSDAGQDSTSLHLQFGNLAKASLCQSGRIKKITVEDWAISGGLKRLDNLISGDSSWQYGHCDRLGNSLRGCSWPSQRSSQGDIWKCDDCKI